MAGVKPTKFINYVSQFKKLLVTRNNGTITQKFKVDSNITDDYYFSIVNSKNQLVDLTGRSFKIYGSVIDAKDDLHILFYSDTADISENGTEMHFKINTYNTQYMSQIKNTKIIDLTIIEVVDTNENNSNQGGGEGNPDDEDITQVILRDTAVAYKRPYIDNVQPTELVYKVLLTTNVPLTGCFGSGQDISLTYGSNGAAFGTGLDQTGDNQLVIGKYNEADNTKVFVIGNGSNDTARSNLFTIDYDGNITTSGALSATAVYINGQEVGTQVDQKLASTSAWVNETFETKESSTSAYNSLVEEIGAVDLKVEGLSSTVVSDYALKSQLPTKVSDLTNDAGYITSSEIPTDYVTNGQLDSAISSFITIEDVPVYTGSGAVVVDQNHVISLTGQLGKTYNADNVTLELDQEDNTFSIKSIRQKITAGSGISLSEDQQTGITTISVFGSGTSGDAVQYFEGEGISIDDYTISINQTWLNSRIPTKVSQLNNDLAFVPSSYLATYATKAEIPTVPTNVGAFTNDVGYLTAHQSLADYYTKTQTDSAIATATDDLATETYVQTASANIVAQIPNSGTIIDVATGAIPTGVASFANDAGYLTAHQDLTDYAKTSEVNSAIEAATSGKADLSALEAVDDKFDNYYTSVQVDSAIETASASIVGQIPLSTSQLVNDSGYLTAHQSLVGYATETYVDGAIDTASASIVAQIPTSASQLANDVPYLTAHQSLDNYYNKTQVDTALALKADSVDVYTKTEVNNAITSATSGKADKSELQSVSGTLNTVIGTKAASADVYSKSQVYTKTEADNKFLTEHQSLSNYYTKSQVYTKDETDTEIYAATSGAASKTWVNNQGFAKTADLPTVPTKVSDLQNDAGYLTSIPSEYVTQTELTAKGYLTAVPSEYALKTDIPTYTGASGISVDSNHVIAITGDVGKTYTGGTDIEITTGNVINFTGTIPSIEGLASETYVDNAIQNIDIPTAISDLTNDSEFATSANVTTIIENTSAAIVNGLATEQYVGTQIANTSASIINGLATQSFVTTEIGKIDIPSKTSDLTNDSDYITSGQVDTKIANASGAIIQGLATESYVGQQIAATSGDIVNGLASQTYVDTAINALSDVYAQPSAIEAATSGKADLSTVQTNYALKSELPVVSTYVAGNNVSITSTGTNQYTVAATDTTYVEGTGVTISGATNIIAVDQEWLEGFVANLGYITHDSDTLYHADEETINLTVVNDQNTFSVNQTWLNNFLAAKEYATTGYVTGYCSGYALKSEIPIVPTNVGDFTNNVGYLTAVPAEDKQAISGAAVASAKNYVDTALADYTTTTDLASTYETKADTSTLCGQLSAAISGKADLSTVQTDYALTSQLSSVSATLTTQISTKADTSTVTAIDERVSAIESSYISGMTFIDGDGQEISTNEIHLSDDIIITDDEGSYILGINDSSIARIDDIPDVSNFIDLADASGVASTVVQNYITVSGLATTGYVDDAISGLSGEVSTNYALKSDIPQGVTWTGQSGIVVDNANSTITLTAHIPTDAEMSGVVSNVLTASGVALESDIPTAVSDLTNDSGYITGITFEDGDNQQFTSNIFYVSDDLVLTVDEEDENKITLGINGSLAHLEDIPTGLGSWTSATNFDYISGLGFITGVNLNGYATQDWVTSTALADYAKTSAIPTSVSELTNDVGYLTAITVEVEDSGSNEFTGVYFDNSFILDSQYVRLNTNKIIEDHQIATTGWVNDYCSSFATTSALSSVSGTLSSAISGVDSRVSDIENAGYITDVTLNYNGNSYNINEIDIGNGLRFDTGELSLDGTIPLSTSQLTNDSGFITASDIPAELSGSSTIDITDSVISLKNASDYIMSGNNVSKLNNDAGYITSIPTSYAQLSDIPSVEGLISASQAETIANNAITSTVTSGYLTGLGIATTGQIPTKTSDLTNDSGYITASDIPAQTVYTNGNGIASATVDGNVQFSLSTNMFNDLTGIANRGANKVLSSTSESGLIWTDNVAGTDIDTICGMLSSANNNLTISKTDNKILFTATGGGGSTGNIVGGAGIRVMQDGGNTVISIATASLAMAPSSYTIDFRNTSGTVDFDYISYTGNQNLIRTISGSLPNGITASGDISGYQFDYVSAANCNNGTTVVTAWFDAYDITQSTSAEVTFTTIGFVDQTLNAIASTLTFDFTNDDVVTGYYVFTYSGNFANLTASIQGLMEGFTYDYSIDGQSGIFTIVGDSSLLNFNGNTTFNISFNAPDIVTGSITNTMTIVGVQIDYSTKPLTFESVGDTVVALNKGNEIVGTYPLSTSFDGGSTWTSYTAGTEITLHDGDMVSFYGSENTLGMTGWVDSKVHKFTTTGTGTLKLYGKINSLNNYATNTAMYLYTLLFNNCTRIADAANLIIPTFTNVQSNHYNVFMYTFQGCTALTAVPKLPSSTLPQYGYWGMFQNCTALSTVPSNMLPATTLAYQCYYGMFDGCTNLVAAPYLPASSLVNECYEQMFKGCTSLTSIQVNFTSWKDGENNDCTTNWVQNINTVGNFISPSGLANETGVNRIPTNWTKRNVVVADIPTITFMGGDSGTAVTSSIVSYVSYDGGGTASFAAASKLPSGISISNDGTISCIPSASTFGTYTVGVKIDTLNNGSIVTDVTIVIADPALYEPLTVTCKSSYDYVKLEKMGSPNSVTLQYNKNNTGWQNYSIGDVISMSSGDTVAFSGANDHFSKDADNYYGFNCERSNLEVSGNIMSLMDFSNTCTSACFTYFFNGIRYALRSVSGLMLPATTLAEQCYRGMFQGCSYLTSAPTLPADVLAPSCYYQMFSNCTSLQTAPQLLATTLTNSCYQNMFYDCRKLTAGPTVLPATTVLPSSYQDMFYSCSSLVTAPEIMATSFNDYSCYEMFNSCSSLTSITVHFTNWDTTHSSPFFRWVSGVAANGTFYHPAGLTDLTQAASKVPSGWSTQVIS